MLKHIFILIVILASTLPMVYASRSFAQTVVYVDEGSSNTSAASISNPGNSWSGAYKYLQNGLIRADQLLSAAPTVPVQIWVAEGSYRPDVGHDSNGNALNQGDRNLSFVLRNSVAIYGGFNGSGDDELSDRDPYTNITILTGDLAVSQGQIDTANFGNRSDNAIHVVYGNIVNASARLDGFRIRGGNADGAGLAGPRKVLTKVGENRLPSADSAAG